MAKAAPYVPPPDPDFRALALAGYEQWKIDRPKVIAFDTETHGLAFNDGAFCATVAWENETGVVGHYFEFDKFDSREAVRRIFAAAETFIGHNLKFDLQKAIHAGVLERDRLTPEHVHDSEALAHLDNEHRPKGLKDLMVTVLGHRDVVAVEQKDGTTKHVPREKHELDFVRRKMKLTKNDPWSLLPRAIVMPYAVKDATATLELYLKLRPLVAQYGDLWGLYEQEMELTLVLLDMETAGMRIEREYVARMIREYTKRVFGIDQEIEEIVGKPVRTGKMTPKEKPLYFNPASAPQIKETFTELGFERDSYDDKNLAQINHPLAAALRRRRADAKILSTYFMPMKDEERDGILNPNFRQHGTVTGRMSSGKQEG